MSAEENQLDPEPWVDLNDVRWSYGVRPYDSFAPRPQYSQNREDYS